MAKELKIGDKAPAFKLKDQSGETVSLSDFKGQPVVLYFYPKDMTPGCTQEACDFRDNFARLKKGKTVVLGVSKDTTDLHKKFATKYELNFPLLADIDGKACEAYGAWQEKSMYGKKYMGTNRITFIIDEEGTIAHIITKVDTKSPTEQVLQLL